MNGTALKSNFPFLIAFLAILHDYGLPMWLSGKEPTCQCGRCGFDPWDGKTPWRRERLLTPVFGLENTMDCIVHGVAKSWTRLSERTLSLSSAYLR